MNVEDFASLGDALTAALEKWGDAVCVIESNREKENARLTYREFGERARPVAAALAERGLDGGDRAAVLLTNQSKWHLAAYAIFRQGGVLVPLDFKLPADEHLRLLAHAKPQVLIIEFFLWRALSACSSFAELAVPHVLVTESPPNGSLDAPAGVRVERWDEATIGPNDVAPVSRRREDVACIVYSSGTGGRAKGCQLTHENYLEQFRALTALHPFGPGVRYLSILPTNHAIDFMVGFIGPYLCGATVIHLRTLRPELVRDALVRYRITHLAVVPLVLRNLEASLRERFAALPALRRLVLWTLIGLNRLLSRGRPDAARGRRLLRGVHAAFGGVLEAIFVGGAPSDSATLSFFHDLGIPVANGYGLTEAGTAITLDRLDPARPDTVGVPLPGTEVEIRDPNADGVGEIVVRSRTVMSGYLDDPELTAETIVDGWLLTGDLGRMDSTGHLQIVGRKKNMIVTAGGKNVYPEDVEGTFADLEGVKELAVFAAHFLWPDRTERDERLLLVVCPDPEAYGQVLSDYASFRAAIEVRNRRLQDFKRVQAFIVWDEEFPRTASMKIKRQDLAAQIGARYGEKVSIPSDDGSTLEIERGVIALT